MPRLRPGWHTGRSSSSVQLRKQAVVQQRGLTDEALVKVDQQVLPLGAAVTTLNLLKLQAYR